MADINVGGTLSSAGNFPITYDVEQSGGFRVVADAAERNAISDERRIAKMVVVQADTGQWYELNIAPWNNTDSDWTAVTAGGGGGGGDGYSGGTFIVKTGASQAGTTYPNWTTFLAGASLVQGLKTVLVDNNGSTNVALPLNDATNFDGQLNIVGINQTRGGVDLDGYCARNIRNINNVTLNLTSGKDTPILQGNVTGETSLYAGDIFLEDVVIANASSNALIGPVRLTPGPSYVGYRLTIRGQFTCSGLLWEVSPTVTSTMYVSAGVTIPPNSIMGAVGSTLNVYVEPGGDFNPQTSTFFGTLNVYTLALSGIQYQGSHVTTRQELNFTGSVVVTDDFSNNRITVNNTAVSTAFYLNSAATPSGNVYDSWGDLWTAVNATVGFKTIYIEDGTVPAGSYSADGLIDLVGFDRYTSAQKYTQLTFDNGASIRNLKSIKNLSVAFGNSSPIIQGSLTADSVLYNGSLDLQNVDFTTATDGYAISYPVGTGNTQDKMKLFVNDDLSLRNSARLILWSPSGSVTRELHLDRNITLPDGSVCGGLSSPATTTNVYLSNDTSFGTQTGLLGTINKVYVTDSAVQNSGTTVAARKYINFSGSAVQGITDDSASDRINIVLSKDGGAASLSVEEEGVLVTAQPTMNFKGISVTAEDDPGNSRVNITIDPLIHIAGPNSPSNVDGYFKQLTFSRTVSTAGAVTIADLGGDVASVGVSPFTMVKKAGSLINSAPYLNFVGDGVSVASNGGAQATDITIDPVMIADEGTNVAAKPTINFVGAGVTATLDVPNDRVNVQIDGAGSITVQDDGYVITSAVSNVNFIGAGVTAVYDGMSSQVDVTIPGAAYIEVEDEGSSIATSFSIIDFTGPGVSSSYNGGLDKITVDVSGKVVVGKAGSTIGTRRTINFTGEGVGTVADDVVNDRVNIDIPGLQVMDEGSNAGTPVPKLNFIGSNISAAYNGAQNRVDVTLSTGAGTIDVMDEGLSVGTRGTINFIGSGVTAVDDPGNGRVNITISSSPITIDDEGTPLTQRAIVNFTGGGVAASDDAGNSRTEVNVPGLTVRDGDSSTTYNTVPYISFVGAGVTTNADYGNNQVEVIVDGYSSLEVLEEGSSVGTRPAINFIGSNVTAVDDPGNNRINVTVTGSSGGGGSYMGTPSHMPLEASALVLYLFDETTDGTAITNYGSEGSGANATVTNGTGVEVIRGAIGLQFPNALRIANTGDAVVSLAHSVIASGAGWPSADMSVWCSFVPTAKLGTTSRILFKQYVDGSVGSPATTLNIEWNPASNGSLDFSIYTSTGTHTISCPSVTADFLFDQPMMVGLTLTGGVFTAYVNGQSVGSVGSAGTFDPGTGALVFGNFDDGSPTGVQDRIGGLYHEFGLANTALDATWFQNAYNRYVGYGGLEVQSNGSVIAARSTINFIGAVITDDPANDRINISAGGGGDGYATAGEVVGLFDRQGVSRITLGSGGYSTLSGSSISSRILCSQNAMFTSIYDGGNAQLQFAGQFGSSSTSSIATLGTAEITGNAITHINNANADDNVYFGCDGTDVWAVQFHFAPYGNQSGVQATGISTTQITTPSGNVIVAPSEDLQKYAWVTIPSDTTNITWINVGSLAYGDVAHYCTYDLTGPMIYIPRIGLVAATSNNDARTIKITNNSTSAGTTLFSDGYSIVDMCYDGERIYTINSGNQLKAYSVSGSIVYTILVPGITAKSKIEAIGNGNILVSVAISPDADSYNYVVGYVFEGVSGKKLTTIQNDSIAAATNSILGVNKTGNILGIFDDGTDVYWTSEDIALKEPEVISAQSIKLRGDTGPVDCEYGELVVIPTLPNTIVSTSTYLMDYPGSILVDTTTIAITVSLSSQYYLSKRFLVKDYIGNAGTNTITIDVNGGGTIDGASSVTITTNWGWKEFISNGSGVYFLIGQG